MLNHLAEQLGVWMIGQALPRKPALDPILRHAGGLIAGSVITGLLAGAILILGLLGMHALLTSQGLAPLWAGVTTGSFALLFLVMALLWTQRQVDKLTSMKEALRPDISPLEGITDALAPLIDAFVEGLQEPQATDNTSRNTEWNTVSMEDIAKPENGHTNGHAKHSPPADTHTH